MKIKFEETRETKETRFFFKQTKIHLLFSSHSNYKNMYVKYFKT